MKRQPLHKAYAPHARGAVHTRAYDQYGRISHETDPENNTTSYAYDAFGRTIAVTNALGEVTHGAYDLEGRTIATWGNTYPVAYQYDAMSRMTAMATTRDSDADFTALAVELANGASLTSIGSIWSLDLTQWLYHEPTGLLTNKLYADGKGTSYTYTPDGKLATRTWVRGITTTYSYDTAQNLASISYWRYSVSAIPDPDTPNVSFTHDRLGRITSAISDGRWQYTWNGENRLVKAVELFAPTNRQPYVALGEGQGEGETTFHVYDDNWQVLADLDAASQPLRSYTWGPGIDNLLAMTTYDNDATNTYYAVKDHLGSVHALVDASSATVESYRYDAWGNLLEVKNSVGQVLAVSAFGNRYLFQGREYSYATGLYHFRHRWYDPETARWLSNDPIGISGGLNLYEFCGSNPVNFVDPLGLCEEGSKWDKMEWWEKLSEGYYYGTGYGEDALQYYVDITLDPNAPWYQKVPAYVGGFFTALWTPETYQATGWTLISAYGARNAGSLTVDGASGTRRFQIRNRTTGEPYVRVDKGPVPGKRGPRTHYHRRPDIKKHRPYEGL